MTARAAGRPHTARTLHAHRTHTGRTPHAHRTHTGRTPHAHRTHALHARCRYASYNKPYSVMAWLEQTHVVEEMVLMMDTLTLTQTLTLTLTLTLTRCS